MPSLTKVPDSTLYLEKASHKCYSIMLVPPLGTNTKKVRVSPQPEKERKNKTTHDRIMAWSLTLPPPPSLLTFHAHTSRSLFPDGVSFTRLRHRPILSLVPSAGNKDADLRVSSLPDQQRDDDGDEPTPQDLQYVAQVKRVLELLRKNRDMLFGEVKLTIMIEDPREVERRRLLGIEYSEGPTRDDLVDALEEVNEGKIPKNRAALQMLAEELTLWPNIEDEAPKKKRGKSLYAKATDTGIDPEVAAKKLNTDWDSAAAEIEEMNVDDETGVPPVVGYGALYLVSAFPIIIGISVVLILFYNSLQ
ncbi:unnamed protein product [Sphenostylis stenocarpa]|uniref:Ycf3-interacting protein 1, chloroplastic n=1 Tax=Sphenostylis stenocarpa TaxID=92480 RepID=A0AA86S4S4_9FABA|nr:unnamed protein product [Sphenostylis stenocarpa]